MRAIIILVMLCGVATARPAVFVQIASAHDDSPDEADAVARDTNRETIRMALLAAMRSSPQLTNIEAEAKKLGIEARTVDVTIVKLHAEPSDYEIGLSVELKFVVSDGHGKILSVVTGVAKTEVSPRAFGTKLPSIRRQLLVDAVQGVFGPLRQHLVQSVASL